MLKKIWEGMLFCWSVFDWWTTIKGLFVAAAPIAILAAGMIGEIQPMYTILAAFVGLCCSALALNNFTIWRKISSPGGKLRLNDFHWGWHFAEAAPDAELFWIQPYLVIQNLADFQISYQIERFDWSIANRLPDASSAIKNTGGIIEPGLIVNYRQAYADVRGVDFSQPVDGKLSVKIKYGRPGKEGFTWEQDFEFTASRFLTPDGMPSLGMDVFHGPPQLVVAKPKLLASH